MVGWPKGQVVNQAIESGSVWEALVILRRNPGLVSNCRLVIFGIHPIRFTRGQFQKRMSQYDRYCTWRERFTVDEWEERAHMLFSWLRPYQVERRRLISWLAGLTGHGPEVLIDAQWTRKPAWGQSYASFRHREQKRSFETVPHNGEILSMELSTQQMNYFQQLVQFWREREVPVVLMTLPIQQRWLEFAASAPRIQAMHDTCLDIVQAELDSGVVLLRFDAKTCSLDDNTHFFDHLHLTPEGASIFTTVVGESLLKNHGLPFSNSAVTLTRSTTR